MSTELSMVLVDAIVVGFPQLVAVRGTRVSKAIGEDYEDLF